MNAQVYWRFLAHLLEREEGDNERKPLVCPLSHT